MNNHLVNCRLLLIKHGFLFFILINVPSNSQASPIKPINQANQETESLLKICVENAKLGNLANQDLLSYCNNRFNLSNVHSTFCKKIPPKAEQKKIEDFDKFLSDGVENINDQVTSYTSRDTKLYRAVFIMGNSGSGKTTLSKILTKNLNHLYATFTDVGQLHLFENQDSSNNPKGLKFQGLVPLYVVNYENNVAFWDCPGFDDDRDAKMDYAAKYFIERAVDLTSRAKFIFTVSHSAFKKGDDGKEFDLLVTNVIHLFTNFSKFEDSFGIVVTKVNHYMPNGKHRNDQDILAEINESLAFYLIRKRQQLQSEEQEEIISELRKKIYFIEILLGKGNDKSSKVSLEPVLTKCGPLSEIPSVFKSRREITVMLQRSLKYSSIISQDLQFTSGTEFRQELNESFISNALEKFASVLSVVSLDILARFPNKFHDKYVRIKVRILEKAHRILDKMKNIYCENINATTPAGNDPSRNYLSKEIEHLYQSFGLDMKCSSISTLVELETRIGFFVKITKQNYIFSSLHKLFVSTFAEISSHLEYLLEFYQTYHAFMYEFLDFSKKYQVILLLRQASSEILNNDDKIIEYIFRNNIFSNNVLKLKAWNSTKPIEKKLLASWIRLWQIQSEIKCLKYYNDDRKIHVVLQGNSVMLSDLFKTQNWPSNCTSGKPIAEITILGQRQVFIDTDIYPRTKETDLPPNIRQEAFPGIEKVDQVDLSIIASDWFVIGNRHIVLDGFQPVDMEQAQSGNSYGDNGIHGKAGVSGGNAGNFFGIYEAINDEGQLYISANGGNGGNGQQGGNGHTGKNGRNAKWEDFPHAFNFDVCNPKKEQMEFGFRGKANRTREYHWEKMEACINDRSRFSGTYYSKLGGIGHSGGNGGNGGRGGDPGNLGQIDIVLPSMFLNTEMYDYTLRQPTNNQGLCGKPGLGGSGGIGGVNGNYYACKYYSWKWDQCGSHPDNIYSGKNGTNGDVGELCSNSTKYVASKFQPWRALTNFRIYYFRNPPGFDRHFLIDYWYNEQIHERTPIISLAIEIEQMEGKMFEMGNILSGEAQKFYYKCYKESLDRLEEYFEVRFPTKNVAIQDRVALKMIFGAVLGKLTAFRRRESQLHVIKTKEYFDTLKLQMISLESKQREKKISDETHIYKSRLDEKVNEALDFIKSTVNPAIESAHQELKHSNDKLLEEINKYLKSAEEDLEQKKKLKKQMETASTVNLVLGVFSFTSSICSMLGPVGQTAAAAINLGTGITKAVIGSSNITDKDYESVKLPTGFKNSLSGATVDYYKNRIDYIDKQTSYAAEAAGNVTDEILHGVKVIAERNRIELDSLKSKVNDNEDLLDMQDVSKILKLEESVNLMAEIAEQVSEKLFDFGENLEDANEIHEKDSKIENVTSVKKPAKAKTVFTNIKVVKGLATGMKILKTGGTLMKSIIDGDKDVLKMADAVRNAERNHKLVEQKKNQFYGKFLKDIKFMNDQLNNLTSELPGQSKVRLIVKNWEVKKMLKNMRALMFQFTQAMQVTETFRNGFDTLDEALTLLIKLYDQIEHYEEKKQLADFICNVNSANDLEQINDIELKQVLIRMDFYISANLFLEDYQKGIHALKQWAFPFGYRYLNQMEPPKLSRDLPTMISGYKKQVESISLTLDRYAAATVDGDQNLMVNLFSSDAVSSEPFYKWSNEKWKNAIKKLLAGEQIRLKADVDMIGQDSASYFRTKSAIKFKSLVLVLKARDKIRQSELESTLDHFQMTMTHSGISLYKIMGQHFVMYDRNITYHYSFEKTSDNKRVTVNGVKYKVDGPGADFLLSPYTWWTFQIHDAKDGGLGFRDLEQFEDEIDLELEGDGVYLEETKISSQDLNDLKLAEYYEVYDSETKWDFDADDYTDTCIVNRTDIMEAEKIEILETPINMTSLATSNTGEWNTFSVLKLTFLIVGVLLILFGLLFYIKRKYFAEYRAVPVRSDHEPRKEENAESNELFFLH